MPKREVKPYTNGGSSARQSWRCEMNLCLTFVLTFELFHRALLSLAAPGDVKPPMMQKRKTVASVRQRRPVKICYLTPISLSASSA